MLLLIYYKEKLIIRLQCFVHFLNIATVSPKKKWEIRKGKSMQKLNTWHSILGTKFLYQIKTTQVIWILLRDAYPFRLKIELQKELKRNRLTWNELIFWMENNTRKNQHEVIIRGMASVLQHHVISASLLICTDLELFFRIPGRRNNHKGY